MLSICTAPGIGPNVRPFESCRIELLMQTCLLKLYTVCTTFLQQTEIWIIVSSVMAWCCNTDDQSRHLPLYLTQVSWKTPLFTIRWTVAEDSLFHIVIPNYIFLLLYKDMNEKVQYWSSDTFVIFCIQYIIPDDRLTTLTLRVLMSYIYGAPILDVSRSHTTTHHSR